MRALAALKVDYEVAAGMCERKHNELMFALGERDETREANARSNREWLATAQQLKDERDEARKERDVMRREREEWRARAELYGVEPEGRDPNYG